MIETARETLPNLGLPEGLARLLNTFKNRIKNIISPDILRITAEQLTIQDEGETVKFMYQGEVVGIYEIGICDNAEDGYIYLDKISSVNLLRTQDSNSIDFLEHAQDYVDSARNLWDQEGINILETKLIGIGEYMLTHLAKKGRQMGLQTIIFNIANESQGFYQKTLKRLKQKGEISDYTENLTIGQAALTSYAQLGYIVYL